MKFLLILLRENVKTFWIKHNADAKNFFQNI